MELRVNKAYGLKIGWQGVGSAAPQLEHSGLHTFWHTLAARTVALRTLNI